MAAQFGPHRWSAGGHKETGTYRGADFTVADLTGATFVDCDGLPRRTPSRRGVPGGGPGRRMRALPLRDPRPDHPGRGYLSVTFTPPENSESCSSTVVSLTGFGMSKTSLP